LKTSFGNRSESRYFVFKNKGKKQFDSVAKNYFCKIAPNWQKSPNQTIADYNLQCDKNHVQRQLPNKKHERHFVAPLPAMEIQKHGVKRVDQIHRKATLNLAKHTNSLNSQIRAFVRRRETFSIFIVACCVGG
jgi:hypothetical protein